MNNRFDDKNKKSEFPVGWRIFFAGLSGLSFGSMLVSVTTTFVIALTAKFATSAAAFTSVGAALGAGGAALAVGVVFCIGLPALVFAAAFAIKAYRDHKKSEQAIKTLQQEYEKKINAITKNQPDKDAYDVFASAMADQLEAAYQNRNSVAVKIEEYAKQLLSVTMLASVLGWSGNQLAVINRCINYFNLLIAEENKRLQKECNDIIDAIPQDKLHNVSRDAKQDAETIYKNTSNILQNFDNMRQLNLIRYGNAMHLPVGMNEAEDAKRYHDALKANRLARKQLKTLDAAGHHSRPQHKSFDEDRQPFFKTIADDYERHGFKKAAGTFVTKFLNRSRAFVGGAMIPIGIGLTVLGFIGLLTGPVGWALIGACIGIGVAAVGFGAATTYLAYKSDHDQAMRLKELNIRNGFVTQAIATHDTIKAQQEDAKKDSKIQKLKQEAVVAKASIEKLTAELAKQSAEKIVHPQKGAHPVGITVSHDKVVTLHGVMNDMLHPTNHQQPVNASVAPQQARNEEVEETKEEKKGEPGAHSPSSHT